MELYDVKTGTNTRRVRIFLGEKGVKLPTVEVDMMKAREQGSRLSVQKSHGNDASPRTG